MFDLLVWVAFCYLALRILLRSETRLWPLLGLVAGVGLETKDSVIALLGAFVLGLLVVGSAPGPARAAGLDSRRHRRHVSPALRRLGDRPRVAHPRVSANPGCGDRRVDTRMCPTSRSRPPTSAAAAVLVGLGVRELWREPRLRSLALLAPATSLLFFLEQGRSYYSLPAMALPLAAGAVAAGPLVASLTPAGDGLSAGSSASSSPC